MSVPPTPVPEAYARAVVITSQLPYILRPPGAADDSTFVGVAGVIVTRPPPELSLEVAMINAMKVQSVTPPLTDADFTAAFEKLIPELQSRITACAKHTSDPEEVAAELWAHCWANFKQKASRGELLTPSWLMWFAWKAVEAGRTCAGSESVTDVTSVLCHRRGRSRLVSICALSNTAGPRQRRDNADQERLARDFNRTISGSYRESPFARAATRIDWAALSRGLSPRLRNLLHRLSRGERPSDVAEALGLSRGRVSQLVGDLKREVVKFFGADLPVQV